MVHKIKISQNYQIKNLVSRNDATKSSPMTIFFKSLKSQDTVETNRNMKFCISKY